MKKIKIEDENMKNYSVLCFEEKYAFDKIVTVRVAAEDKESAKKEALKKIRKTFPNAMIAPELPGTEVVMEVDEESNSKKIVDDLINSISKWFKSYENKVAKGKSLIDELSDLYTTNAEMKIELFFKMMIDFCRRLSAVDGRLSYEEYAFVLNSCGMKASKEDYEEIDFTKTPVFTDPKTNEFIDMFLKIPPIEVRFKFLEFMILLFSIDGITEKEKQYLYDFYDEYIKNYGISKLWRKFKRYCV